MGPYHSFIILSVLIYSSQTILNNLPNLLVWVAAQPLHENIGVEAVGGAAQ